MTTFANVKRTDSAHWYAPTGEPMHTVIAKGNGLPRPTTLADARKLNLLPSVTTILKLLDKPALTAWKVEQAVLACLSSPRNDGEELDAFVTRILSTERVQDQEGQIARDRGTEIHDALEAFFASGVPAVPNADIWPWIEPACLAIRRQFGASVVATEKILVGDGYAGKADLITLHGQVYWLADYKTTKKLPDPKKGGAWSEHRLQLAAYAKAFKLLLNRAGPGGLEVSSETQIRTANVYISTLEQGAFSICEHEDWLPAYTNGFSPLVSHWQWANNYRPA